MKLFLILIIINFYNCFTTSYEKKFNPENQKDVIHEFVKDRVNVQGSAHINLDEKKIEAQFDSLLIGKIRILNLNLDIKEKKGLAFDSFIAINKNKNAIFAKDKDFNLIIGNDNKIVTSRDLELKEGFTSDTIYYFAVFTGLYGTIFDLYYVELIRDEEDKSIFIKKFYPKKLGINSDGISWVERSRSKYLASNALFYLGYIFTIPLDMLTGVFQVIFYIMSGGGAK
jgi:hypothetical protein